MHKKHFIVISILHVLLVVSDMIIFHYKQVPDSLRYLFVSEELLWGSFFNPDASMNCQTAPGYPIFLAVIRLFTFHNKFLIAIMQSLVYCSSLYFMLSGLLKKGWLSSSLCTIAAVAVLISPEIYQSNHRILSESFCGSLLLVIGGCLVNGFERKGIKILFITATVLLMITRFEYLLIFSVILYILFYKKEYRMIFIATLVLTCVLLLNGYKNYLTYERFNVFSFGSGTVMYGGNNLNGDGSWHTIRAGSLYLPPSKVDNYKAIHLLNEKCICIKQDSLYKSMALDAWEVDHLAQLKIIPVKFGKLWLIPGNLDFYTRQTEFKPGLQIATFFDSTLWPWYGIYKHAVFLFIYWIYLLSIMFGFYLKIKTRGFKSHDLFMLLLVLIISLIYSIPFYGLGRFHVPVFGFLIIYASFSIQYTIKRLR